LSKIIFLQLVARRRAVFRSSPEHPLPHIENKNLQNEHSFALTPPQSLPKQNVRSFLRYLPRGLPVIMPRLKPDTQRARREHILDAALRCFARGGFHATTMQTICREAGVSPGALYVYFDSKEALIAGLCERDRAEFAERFAQLASAPDFIEALAAIGEHYFINESGEKQRFAIEMGIESTRNPRIAEIFMSVDKFCNDSFDALFRRLQDEGRIAPRIDIPTLVKVFNIFGDGMFWRRAIDPTADMSTVLPVIIEVIGGLLNPTNAGRARAKTNVREARQ